MSVAEARKSAPSPIVQRRLLPTDSLDFFPTPRFVRSIDTHPTLFEAATA